MQAKYSESGAEKGSSVTSQPNSTRLSEHLLDQGRPLSVPTHFMGAEMRGKAKAVPSTSSGPILETGKPVMKCKARWLIRATGQDRAGGQLTLSRVMRPNGNDICTRPRGAGRIWAMKQWPREKGIQESQAETRKQGAC